MENLMVMENSLGLMGKSMLGNGRTDDHMVKELEHYLMEESMLGNTKKWNGTVYDNDRINISKYINGVKQ